MSLVVFLAHVCSYLPLRLHRDLTIITHTAESVIEEEEVWVTGEWIEYEIVYQGYDKIY